MKYATTNALAVLMLAPGLACAHAHLQKSEPAANSVIAAMPAQIMLQFSEATRITRLSIEKEGGTEKQDLKPPADAAALLRITAPKLGPGAYQLNWRGLSDDSHVVKGSVHFTLSGK
jgi:methionine-rich copper-binding protein CopC